MRYLLACLLIGLWLPPGASARPVPEAESAARRAAPA